MTTGFSACKAELASLLADVKAQVSAAAGLSGSARALAVRAQAARLEQFKIDSRPRNPLDPLEVDAIRELDRLAIDVAVTIQTAQVATAVARIAARDAELESIGAALEEHSLDNLSDAKRLRLTPIRDAVTRLTDAVDTAKVLAKELEPQNADEAGIVAAVDDLASRLEALREALRTAAGAGG